MFKKSVRVLVFLFVFLSLMYLSLPRLAKLTGSIIGIFSGNDANINVDFSSNAGRIRDDFYGANTHGNWLGIGTKAINIEMFKYYYVLYVIQIKYKLFNGKYK